MFLTRSEYDRGVNTFSPEGRLFQVEYASEAIKLGSTAIGIQTAEGVVLAVEKRITSKLLVPSSVKKLQKLDEHIGCAMSGLVADARTLIDHARVETQARPFGVALLVAGCDSKGPALYHTDPSGTFTQYEAKAIGAGSEGAQQQLEESYDKSMTLVAAQKKALEILKQVMEEKLNSTNVEMAIVSAADKKFKLFKKSELEAVIKTIDFSTGLGASTTTSASKA